MAQSHLRPAKRTDRLAGAFLDALYSALLYSWIAFKVLDGDRVWQAVGLVVFVFVLFWVPLALWGQTLGMMMVGAKVLRADGEEISAGTAFVRVAAMLGLTVTGVGLVADVAWMLFDQRHQALHDKIAHTRVVAVLRVARRNTLVDDAGNVVEDGPGSAVDPYGSTHHRGR
ncbi:RDD family protein [Actinoallomurus sp. NPDC050550]|uniref:RDD family protein n=1 Tax=Actinoallomurus sp. NPDC050550 TaxID=3154937 RepID=UPI0033F114A2